MTRFEPTNPSQTPNESTRTTSVERNAKRSPRRHKNRAGSAYLGLGTPLGSARDRQRLRDRNAAERVRVEQMLANTPVPQAPPVSPDPRSGANLKLASARSRTTAPGSIPRSTPNPAPMLHAIAGRGCPVCASSKVVSDEVFHGGTMRLSECLHCDHRWTQRSRGRWSELGATMNRGARATRKGPDPKGGVVWEVGAFR